MSIHFLFHHIYHMFTYFLLFTPIHGSFQSWFDFDSAGVDEAREKIIAQEREQNVLGTLHQVHINSLTLSFVLLRLTP